MAEYAPTHSTVSVTPAQPTNGRSTTGPIVDVLPGCILQDIGRGQLVRHDALAFTPAGPHGFVDAVSVGDVVTIRYANGNGEIVPFQPEPQLDHAD